MSLLMSVFILNLVTKTDRGIYLMVTRNRFGCKSGQCTNLLLYRYPKPDHSKLVGMYIYYMMKTD